MRHVSLSLDRQTTYPLSPAPSLRGHLSADYHTSSSARGLSTLGTRGLSLQRRCALLVSSTLGILSDLGIGGATVVWLSTCVILRLLYVGTLAAADVFSALPLYMVGSLIVYAAIAYKRAVVGAVFIGWAVLCGAAILAAETFVASPSGSSLADNYVGPLVATAIGLRLVLQVSGTMSLRIQSFGTALCVGVCCIATYGMALLAVQHQYPIVLSHYLSQPSLVSIAGIALPLSLLTLLFPVLSQLFIQPFPRWISHLLVAEECILVWLLVDSSQLLSQ